MRKLPKKRIVIATAALVVLGSLAMVYLMRPRPGRLGSGLVPITIRGVASLRNGSGPLVVAVPPEIQELILKDCGHLCGTDQIQMDYHWPRDAVFWPMMVGATGSGGVNIGEFRARWWQLFTTYAWRCPDSRTFAYSLIVVVNGSPAYEIKISVSKVDEAAAASNAAANVVWMGPLRLVTW